MTTYLFGNSNRRHIANPNDPDTTLCGIIRYHTAEAATAELPERMRDSEIRRLRGLPLCANCRKDDQP